MPIGKDAGTANDGFESTLRSEFSRIELTSAKILSLLGAILVPCSIVLDYYINPGYLHIFIPIRIAIAVLCLTFFGLSRLQSFQNRGRTLSILSILTVGAGLLVIIHRLGYADPYYAGLNLIYLATMITPWGLRPTLTVCLILYGGYLLPVLFTRLPLPDVKAFVNNNTFQIETIIIASVINHFQRQRRISETVNRLTVEKQSGELREQDVEKRRFIANVSHDLKTPLTIISGHTEILRDSFTQEDIQARYLDYIENSVFRINNLLDMLITTALLDQENAKPRLELYDYPRFVSEFCSHFTIQGDHRNITYTIDVPDEPTVVAIDSIWAERILGNIIHNAFKFTQSGGSITVSCHQDSGFIYTEITDTGTGIPPDKIQTIFDRRVQADEDKQHLGYGLGLTIAKEMVTVLGGEITVTSKIGTGTTFRFSLPVHCDQFAVVKNDRPLAPERRSGSDRRQDNRIRLIQHRIMHDSVTDRISIDIPRYENLSPSLPTILICEDNHGQLHLLIEGLKNAFNLIIAVNGKEGLEKLDRYRDIIRLIISDVRMPVTDGLEFCRQVFAQEAFKHLPFLFLTSYTDDAEQLQGLSYGATDYLQKPYNRVILIEKINHWLSRRNHEQILENLVSTLDAKNREICNLQSIITHEIRNPLMILDGIHFKLEKLRSIHAASADTDEKKLWESVNQIMEEVVRIDEVLNSARIIETGITQVTLRDEPVAPILEKTLAETSRLTRTVKVRVMSGLEPAERVRCDGSIIMLVLVNLIRNATEAIEEAGTPFGLITITAKKAGSRILFSISDNGIGIPEATLSNLFRYHYTTKKDGNGIGLYFCKRILNIHGGEIRVESQQGKGTVVTIELPAA